MSALDREGRTIWIADAHRDAGKRFVVREDEKLTAFVELDSVTRTASGSLERLVRPHNAISASKSDCGSSVSAAQQKYEDKPVGHKQRRIEPR